MTDPLRMALALLLLLTVCACKSAPKPDTAPEADPGDYPGDFSMSLLADTGTQRWVYHLYANRALHAASGDGVSLKTNTPRTATISRDDMAKAYWLLRAFAQYEQTRDVDGGPAAGRPIQVLEVHWTDTRKTRRREAYGLLNPPGVDLVKHLTALRGGDPATALPANAD